MYILQNPELFLRVVNELSLSKQVKEINKGVKFIGMEFNEPHIKPNIFIGPDLGPNCL